MNLDPDKITVDRSGTYKPKTIRIAMVGDKMVDLDWALSAMTLRIPLHVHFEKVIAPGVDAAINDWRDNSQTTHLLVWPAGQVLRWDAISEALAMDVSEVRIGKAKVTARDTASLIGTALRSDLGTATGIPEALSIGENINPARSLVIAIPSLGKVSLRWAANLLALASPIGITHHLMVVTGRTVDDAREHIARTVLAMSPRPAYLLFFGDDNLPPANGMPLLFHAMEQCEAKRIPCDAVGGLYYLKHDPPQAVAWRGQRPIQENVDFETGNLVEVDGLGLDFCLLKVDALAKLADSEPMFKTVETIDTVVTEDVYFWQKFAKALRQRPFCHTGCRVGHYDWKTDHVY